MAARFTVKLDVNNFGPHYGDKRIEFFDEVDSNKAINAEVNKAKQELRDQGVLPSTKEFSLIEKKRLRGDEL